MYFEMYSVLLVLSVFAQLCSGLYLKPIAASPTAAAIETPPQGDHKDVWTSFQRQLGLTNQKVELLKLQKDQKGTMDLMKRFIRENPKYTTPKEATNSAPAQQLGDFATTYNTVLEQLRKIRGTLKTSLNFEMSDQNSHKEVKRPRRKIAVRMVSDMPTDKINDLLALFNEKYGLEKSATNDDDYEEDANNDADNVDFNMIGGSSALPSAADPDYMYENLYEDEKDLAVPVKSNRNTDFGSFQDLVFQATRSQWQREREETKLHTTKNQHFDE